MSLERLQQIRTRLDALGTGHVEGLGVWERTVALFARPTELPPMAELERLDRELDRVGLHTAGDARLLRRLGEASGKLHTVAEGLRERAVKALDTYEAALRIAERAVASGEAIPGAGQALERGYVQLARAVKVAALFSRTDSLDRPFEVFRGPPPPRGAASSPLVEIAQFWATRADQNVDDLERKRRDLDSAHELLLRLSTQADRDRVRQLRLHVGDSRERLHGLPTVRSLQDLVRHVRVIARKDPRAAYRSLKGLYERAVEAGDEAVAEAAHVALQPFLAASQSVARSLEQADVARLGLEKAPAIEPTPAGAQTDARLAGLAFELDEERLALFELAAGAHRYFDVESALSEVVVDAEVIEKRPQARRVSYPTQRMNFEVTGSLAEVSNFVLNDPRTLVYDLASNRQLVRTYLDEAPPPKPKRLKRTAVRVYVCDASGSMHGPRARFRDAILIAELNNLRQRSLRGEPVDPLYYCYFNDRPTKLARVENAEQATRHIEALFRSSPAEGRTEITMSLVAAFETLRAAKGSDPYLAHATVVLVTDGEDRIEVDQIRASRAPVGELDIALSFIALGEENPDLRKLALEQRAKGGRAFYQHVTDAEIASARTEFDTGLRTLLPQDVEPTPDVLEHLMPHLEALEALARDRGTPAAISEVAFDTTFPEPEVEGTGGGVSGEDLERLSGLLDALAEAASLAPPETRAHEAVTLLHHLLGVYAIPYARYSAAVAAPPPALRQSVERLRLVCRPFS